MDRQTTNNLLDEAKKQTGSDYKTAQKLMVSRMAVSNWRHDKKPMPVADITLAADLAGMDAVEWTARAVAAQHEGTDKGEALKRALKKALQATGAAMLSSTAKAAAAMTAFHEPISYLIRCIKCKSMGYVHQ